MRFRSAGIVAVLAVVVVFGGVASWTAFASGKGEVAAWVNGTPIPMAELEKSLRGAEKRYEMQHQRLDAKERAKLKRHILDVMIDEKLLLAVAKKEGIQVPESEVERTVLRMKLRYRDNKKFERALKETGRTLEELKQNIRRGKIIEKLLKEKARIDPEELEKAALEYYKAHPEEFTEEKAYHVRHILIRVDKNAGEAAKKKARAKAERLLERIRKGEDFAKVAKEASQAPDAKNGGDLGYLIRGRMVPEFEKVAFRLKPGQISDVVKTRFGYHIIQMMDIRPERVLPFDLVREAVKRGIRTKLEDEKRKAYIASLRKKAKIKIVLP